MKFLIGVLFSFQFIPLAFSAPFSTSFVKMDLPPFWNCESNKSGSAWICQSTVESVKPHAMIVVAARPLEEGQTSESALNSFFAQVGGSRSFKDVVSKNNFTSTHQYVRKFKMGGHEWVDAFHYQSEAVEFQTRYLITTTETNSIGITFSAHKTKWDIFKNDFDAVLKSLYIIPNAVLAVVPESSLNNLPAVNPNVPDGSQLGVFAGVSQQLNAPERNENREPAKAKSEQNDDFILMAALAAAVGIVIFIKRRKASEAAEEDSD